MVDVEWGPGPRQERIEDQQLDDLLDRVDAVARRKCRPQDVQVTVEGAGTLGIVVGCEWSMLNHVPADRKPPYMVSIGRDPSDDPLTFYVEGDHHTETLRRNTISRDEARTAIRHFVATGQLSSDVNWEEV